MLPCLEQFGQLLWLANTVLAGTNVDHRKSDFPTSSPEREILITAKRGAFGRNQLAARSLWAQPTCCAQNAAASFSFGQLLRGRSLAMGDFRLAREVSEGPQQDHMNWCQG